MRGDPDKRVRGWLKDFIIPGMTGLIVATGAVVRNEMEMSRHEREIRELRRDADRLDDFGPSGFRDPALHGAVDLQFESLIKEHRLIDRDTWKSWHDSYFQLNPQCVRPVAVKENHEVRMDPDWRP